MELVESLVLQQQQLQFTLAYISPSRRRRVQHCKEQVCHLLRCRLHHWLSTLSTDFVSQPLSSLCLHLAFLHLFQDFHCVRSRSIHLSLSLSPSLLVGIRHVLANMSSPGNDAVVGAQAVAEEPATEVIDILSVDVPMLNILSCIPLFDLLATIPLTSPRLTQLKAEACRRRHHLTLLLGGGDEWLLGKVIDTFANLPPVDALSKMVFHEKRLTPRATGALTGSLPNVTSLTVSLWRLDDDELLEVLQLLTIWAHQLTNLVIVFGESHVSHCTSRQSANTLFKLFSLQPCINNLTCLRHLTLYMHYEIYMNTAVSFDLPVMSHLESFNCYLSNGQELLFPSMVRYFADNQQARSIDLGGPSHLDNPSINSIKKHQFAAFLELPPTVGRLFSKLKIGGGLLGVQLHRLCDNFPSLRTLSLVLIGGQDFLALPLVARCLRSLHSLTELSLHMGDLASQLEAIQAQQQRLPTGRVSVLEALPTVSFLALSVSGEINSHDVLASLHFAQMLPNLERLFMRGQWYRCSTCELENIFSYAKTIKQAEREKRTACVKMMFAHIRPLFGRLELTEIGFDLFDRKPTIITLP